MLNKTLSISRRSLSLWTVTLSYSRSRFTRLSSGRSDYRVTFKDNFRTWLEGRTTPLQSSFSYIVSKQPSRHVPSQAPSLGQLVPLSHSQVCSHNLITVYNRHGPATHFNTDLYYLFQQNNPKNLVSAPRPATNKSNSIQTLYFSSFLDHIPF